MALSLLIVVLHYSGLADTLECLASLGRQTCDGVHTVLVDNASADRPASRIKADHRRVEVVELAENQGWSGGNNVEIRLAMERGYDLVCLLNNDTILPEGAVARLLETAEFLGPCILHTAIDSCPPDEEPQLDPTIPRPPRMKATPVLGRAGVFEIDTGERIVPPGPPFHTEEHRPDRRTVLSSLRGCRSRAPRDGCRLQAVLRRRGADTA